MHLLLMRRICKQLGTGLLQRRWRLGQVDRGAETRRRAHHERLAILHRDALQLVGRVENATDALVMAGIGSDGAVERATPRTWWLGVRLR